MTRSLEEQVASLERMSSAELRDKWRRLTGAPLPKVSPSLLRLALAWEIQAKALGGLSRVTQQTLDQIGRAKTRTTAARSGMRLVRAWNGKAHVVVVGEDGVIRRLSRSSSTPSATCVLTRRSII